MPSNLGLPGRMPRKIMIGPTRKPNFYWTEERRQPLANQALLPFTCWLSAIFATSCLAYPLCSETCCSSGEQRPDFVATLSRQFLYRAARVSPPCKLVFAAWPRTCTCHRMFFLSQCVLQSQCWESIVSGEVQASAGTLSRKVWCRFILACKCLSHKPCMYVVSRKFACRTPLRDL